MSKKIWGAAGAMRVLANGHEIANVTSVTIPDIENPTAEIKGAGIMGTWNMPISGQVSSMTASITLRAAGGDKKYLLEPVVDLEIRMAFNCQASDGGQVAAGTKFFIRGFPTKVGGGKSEVQSTRDETIEYSAVRFREVVDGVETLLADQIANIYKVGGVDQMAAMRALLD